MKKLLLASMLVSGVAMATPVQRVSVAIAAVAGASITGLGALAVGYIDAQTATTATVIGGSVGVVVAGVVDMVQDHKEKTYRKGYIEGIVATQKGLEEQGLDLSENELRIIERTKEYSDE